MNDNDNDIALESVNIFRFVIAKMSTAQVVGYS